MRTSYKIATTLENYESYIKTFVWCVRLYFIFRALYDKFNKYLVFNFHKITLNKLVEVCEKLYSFWMLKSLEENKSKNIGGHLFTMEKMNIHGKRNCFFSAYLKKINYIFVRHPRVPYFMKKYIIEIRKINILPYTFCVCCLKKIDWIPLFLFQNISS